MGCDGDSRPARANLHEDLKRRRMRGDAYDSWLEPDNSWDGPEPRRQVIATRVPGDLSLFMVPERGVEPPTY